MAACWSDRSLGGLYLRSGADRGVLLTGSTLRAGQRTGASGHRLCQAGRTIALQGSKPWLPGWGHARKKKGKAKRLVGEKMACAREAWGVGPCWLVLGLAGLGSQRLGLGYPPGGLQNRLTWGLKFGLEMGLSLAHQTNEIKYEKCT